MLMQILSDLHLETFPTYNQYKHTVPETATYLALLGDIGHVVDVDFEKLIEKLLDHYAVVFYLLGNHDTARLSMTAAKQRVRALEKRLNQVADQRTIGRFVFLDSRRYDVDSRMTILGCTLYSHVPEDRLELVGGNMIEFIETPGWTVWSHNTAHERNIAWLNAEVEKIEGEESQRSIVILSHHCPTYDARASDPRHKGSAMSCAFMTDLSRERCWKSGRVVLWAWGHTHWNCEFEAQREDTRPLKCFANQRGYFRSPKETFDSTIVVDIENGRVHRKLESPSELAEDSSASSKHPPPKMRRTLSKFAHVIKTTLRG